MRLAFLNMISFYCLDTFKIVKYFWWEHGHTVGYWHAETWLQWSNLNWQTFHTLLFFIMFSLNPHTQDVIQLRSEEIYQTRTPRGWNLNAPRCSVKELSWTQTLLLYLSKYVWLNGSSETQYQGWAEQRREWEEYCVLIPSALTITVTSTRWYQRAHISLVSRCLEQTADPPWKGFASATTAL